MVSCSSRFIALLSLILILLGSAVEWIECCVEKTPFLAAVHKNMMRSSSKITAKIASKDDAFLRQRVVILWKYSLWQCQVIWNRVKYIWIVFWGIKSDLLNNWGYVWLARFCAPIVFKFRKLSKASCNVFKSKSQSIIDLLSTTI